MLIVTLYYYITQYMTSSCMQLASYYDIVVNCTGLGSQQLMDDKLLVPNRGHLVKVRLIIMITMLYSHVYVIAHQLVNLHISVLT